MRLRKNFFGFGGGKPLEPKKVRKIMASELSRASKAAGRGDKSAMSDHIAEARKYESLLRQNPATRRRAVQGRSSRNSIKGINPTDLRDAVKGAIGELLTGARK